MAWRSLSIDEVRLTPAEKAVLANIAGAADVGAEKLGNVIGEFRDTIAAVGTIISPEEGTVPDLAREHVINRTRWLWLCEFPQMKSMQTDQRSKLNDAAQTFLDKITSGDVKVPPGDGSSPSGGGNSAQIAVKPDPGRAANRKKLNGLV